MTVLYVPELAGKMYTGLNVTVHGLCVWEPTQFVRNEFHQLL